MARYDQSYSGEHRTEKVTVQLTPSERRDLEEAAEGQGAASMSAYARELLFRRSAAMVAATRRNPEAAGLMRELNAVGNLLNQIARHMHSTGALRDPDELREALDLQKQAVLRVLAL